jgi:parallel beta-helix repeat protein
LHYTTKNISIVNNTILSSEAGGFSLFGFIDGIVIANNRIYNCKDDAIALQHSSGVYGDVSSITGNVIIDCHTQNAGDSTPNGIHVFGVPNVNITGNTINATYASNIRVQLPIAISQVNVAICGNVCIGAGTNNAGAIVAACGIYVYSTSNTPAHITISGNSIYSPWSDGIAVKNGQFITINANTIKESGLAGIDLDDSKDCIVSNNIIEEAGTRDTNANSIFLIDDSDRNIIIGNRCEGSTNTYYGVAIQANGADNIVAYNNLKGVKTAGISDAGSGTKSHGNISDDSVDIASGATITLLPSGEYFNITGTSNITSVTASWAGRRVVLKFAGILTFTDGSNLKLAGNFVTSADDTIALVCDGTNWHEVSRSVN